MQCQKVKLPRNSKTSNKAPVRTEVPIPPPPPPSFRSGLISLKPNLPSQSLSSTSVISQPSPVTSHAMTSVRSLESSHQPAASPFIPFHLITSQPSPATAQLFHPVTSHPNQISMLQQDLAPVQPVHLVAPHRSSTMVAHSDQTVQLQPFNSITVDQLSTPLHSITPSAVSTSSTPVTG